MTSRVAGALGVLVDPLQQVGEHDRMGIRGDTSVPLAQLRYVDASDDDANVVVRDRLEGVAVDVDPCAHLPGERGPIALALEQVVAVQFGFRGQLGERDHRALDDIVQSTRQGQRLVLGAQQGGDVVALLRVRLVHVGQ